LFTRLAIPFSLIILIVIGYLRIQPGNKEAIEQYQDQVAKLINAMPLDVDGWVGQTVPLPQSAISLLRPNALVARRYYNEETGLSATLMVVQCNDTRDMAGHYPPRCYPANGWMVPVENPVRNYTVDDQEFRVYEFHRLAGKVERAITVYSLFALPNGELTTSMTEVRKLSADYRYRQYGAAQLQVVIDGSVPIEEHPRILDEMYRIAEPAIKAVLKSQAEQSRNEGEAS